MYCPLPFHEDRLDVLHALMRAHPLATLVTAGAGGLMANLVPFTLVTDGSPDGKGVLRAHIAKANDQLEALRQGAPAMVVFQGPEHYVTPSWYASKADGGKVVPTWNYVVVQAHGTPRVIDDAAWVRAQIELLTNGQEAARAEPWQVSDAPAAYVDALLRVIIGIEIPIDRLEGKWKVSQNRPEADRLGVEQGLRHEGIGSGRTAAEAMAQLVAARGPR